MSGFSCQQQHLLVNAVSENQKAVFQALFKQRHSAVRGLSQAKAYSAYLCVWKQHGEEGIETLGSCFHWK